MQKKEIESEESIERNFGTNYQYMDQYNYSKL